MSDSLGDRMKKNYEDRSRYYLTRRVPVIMRIDGRAFHTFTRKFEKPFSTVLHNCMVETTKQLCKEIQGAKLGYTQSDEISILITDFDTLNTEAWFNYNIQKMVSVGASIATSVFNDCIYECGHTGPEPANFDCRVFNIPESEVVNNFHWRQIDWFRNSLSMLARSHFSDKELHGKNQNMIHEMLHTKGVNWTIDLENWKKNGSTILKNEMGWEEYNIIFKDNRAMTENLMKPKE